MSDDLKELHAQLQSFLNTVNEAHEAIAQRFKESYLQISSEIDLLHTRHEGLEEELERIKQDVKDLKDSVKQWKITD